eukprot:362560-Hanusia_phi.AAC.1
MPVTRPFKGRTLTMPVGEDGVVHAVTRLSPPAPGRAPAGPGRAGPSEEAGRMSQRSTVAETGRVILLLRQFESFSTSSIVPDLPAPDLMIRQPESPP